eukprot:jgi/Undpi1/673/HiC_scaffold_10.g04137.m1
MEGLAAPCSGGQSKGPKVRVCYVCGRGYGLASYEIHLKQCKAMWEAKQEGLPAAERKPLPTEPKVAVEQGHEDAGLLEAQNEAATQVFNNEALQACEHCGRTFMEDRLKIHQKSCTSEKPAKPVGAARLSSSSPETPSATATARPRTSRNKFVRPTPVKHSEANGGSEDTNSSTGLPHTSSPLAGNYGGIARRGSRGVMGSGQKMSSSCSDQSPIEVVEERLQRVEQELAHTKAQVKDLLKSVQILQSKVS